VLCSIVARHDSGTAKRREEDGLGVDAITINIKSSPTDHAVNYKNSTNSENEYSHNGKHDRYDISSADLRAEMELGMCCEACNVQ